MRLLSKSKDGGPNSLVTAYWLVEIKSLFSIALLKFSNGSRPVYHNHAFNSWNWVLSGLLTEDYLGAHYLMDREYRPSLWPIRTLRSTFHRVWSWGTSWVFTIRGPWSKVWSEWDPHTGEYTVLSHGRKLVTPNFR